MPLLLPTLQTELISIYEKGPAGNPGPILVAVKTASAYLNFVTPAIDMGGTPMLTMVGVKQLEMDLIDYYSAINPSVDLIAQKIATAFVNCLSTFTTMNSKNISTNPGSRILSQDLTSLFSAPNLSATLFATKFATALFNFTGLAIVSGIIPGAPPIPYSGPLG
jgi:hypothetical protein|tara:strand:+ start:495 stop:986 length:492 start_codon:yes stop_codon:yes gene_type:complete